MSHGNRGALEMRGLGRKIGSKSGFEAYSHVDRRAPQQGLEVLRRPEIEFILSQKLRALRRWLHIANLHIGATALDEFTGLVGVLCMSSMSIS